MSEFAASSELEITQLVANISPETGEVVGFQTQRVVVRNAETHVIVAYGDTITSPWDVPEPIKARFAPAKPTLDTPARKRHK